MIEAELATQTARRQYEMQRPLAERGFVPGRQFADSRDTYEANRRRSDVLRRQQATDERLQSSQLAQLRASATSLNQSLELARAQPRFAEPARAGRRPAHRLLDPDRPVAAAAASGSARSTAPAATNCAPRSTNSISAASREGQVAAAEVGGRAFRMRVSKIYPQVRNGAFEIDLAVRRPGAGRPAARPDRADPADARRPAPALLIPNGAFYNETGGNWVFVVAPDGRTAVKRQVRLGRRNSDFIEVLEGLDPGERVITSPYTGFAERDRLSLSRAMKGSKIRC